MSGIPPGLLHVLLRAKVWLHRHSPKWVDDWYHKFYEGLKK